MEVAMSAVRPEPMPVAGTSAAHPVQALGGLDIMLRIMDGRLPPPAFAEFCVWCSPHHGAKAAVPNFVVYLSTENVNV